MQDYLVFDSSVWIELLKNGPKSTEAKKYLGKKILAPEITLAEVSAKAYDFGLPNPLSIIESIAQQAQAVGLNTWIADRAGKLRREHQKEGLSLNDAIILATAEYYEAGLLTLDNDFKPFKNAIVI